MGPEGQKADRRLPTVTTGGARLQWEEDLESVMAGLGIQVSQQKKRAPDLKLEG